MPVFKDILIVVLVCSVVIAIGIHAPSNSYAYAQMRQMGASLGMLETGNWLLPRNHEGRLMRKPQLYGWLTAPVLWATGCYKDIVYRWPSVAAAIACGIMVYLLGRRWLESRPFAVMAGCFWVTGLHMGKLMYLGTTDMLHVLWMIMAVYFIDKLLLARSRVSRDGWNVFGLWAALILGALTKGWGVANLPFITFYVFLICLFQSNFKINLFFDYLWGAIKKCKLGWGIVAFLLIMIPLCIGMYLIGKEEFLKVVDYEIVQRIRGTGDKPPQGSSLWPGLWLVLMTVPWSGFAVLSFVVTSPKKWIDFNGPFVRPLLWIAATVIPFSFSHGFRPDYLAPCYPAVAILAALGIQLVIKFAKDHRRGAVCRHLAAGFSIAAGLTVSVGAGLYLFRNYLPEFLRTEIPQPYFVEPVTQIILWIALFGGVILAAWSVRSSLKMRLTQLGWAAVIAMICVIYIDRHMISRHARSWDGPTLIAFAEAVEDVVKDDKFAQTRAEKLGTDLYTGRFGLLVRNSQELKESKAKWLVTCDGGLVALGAADLDVDGDYTIHARDYVIRDGKYFIRDAKYQARENDITPNRKDISQVRFKCKPERLGEVINLNITKPIKNDNLGRLYLIKLRD